MMRGFKTDENGRWSPVRDATDTQQKHDGLYVLLELLTGVAIGCAFAWIFFSAF